MSQKFDSATKKANAISGCNNCNIEFKSKVVVFPIYSAMVRHLWKYCAQFGKTVIEKKQCQIGPSLVEGYQSKGYKNQSL